MAIEVSLISVTWFLIVPAVLTIVSLIYGRREALIGLLALYLANDTSVKSFVIFVFIVWFIFMLTDELLRRLKSTQKPS